MMQDASELKEAADEIDKIVNERQWRWDLQHKQ